jgi:arginyl-tRNA synthetase
MRFEGDTGPYLLYSYARARSILGKAKYKAKKYSIPELTKEEKNLVVQMNKLPDVILQSYNNLAPNLIANHAIELSQIFNEFYHACPVIGSKEEQFRLELVNSFSQVLKNALNLLGIDVIEKM